MDQVKIGAFIALLRQEKGWTQEELGERLGVTNKTVSRWENGNYMPGVEMLSLLGWEFGVSLNELVEGKRLDETEFREAADKNLAAAMESRLDRFWRWMERYGAYAAVVFLLCCTIAVLVWGLFQYKNMHPGDVSPVGTWNTYYSAQESGDYIVMDRDGGYYRYRQFEPLERGAWSFWDYGQIIVTTEEGRFDLMLKGHSLFVPGGEGGLQKCGKLSDTPMFINVSPEEFEE